MKPNITTRTRHLCSSLLLPLSLVLFAPETGADTYVGGIITGATWTKDNSPYLVTNDIYVSSLNIREGVEVRFMSNWVFEVGGKLRVAGSAEAPVIFHPLSTNVGWQGLLFRDAVPGSYFVQTIIEGSKNSGVRITNTPPTFTNCVVRNNSSPDFGGGIRAEIPAGQTLIMNGCIISNNLANPTYASGYGYGGGLYVGGSMLLLQSTVVSNLTSGSIGYGAGVFAFNGDCTMRNCSISGNLPGSYTSDDAAGIYYDTTSTGTLQMNNCIVASNGRAGAYAQYSGGGVEVWRGTAKLENCLIAGNLHEGIYFRLGQGSIVNCSVVNNAVDHWGVYSYSGTVGVTNSIVYFQYGANVSGNVVCAYSDVQGGVQPGPGNISFAPGLCPQNQSLIQGSPCIDAGDPGLEFRDGCVSAEDCSSYARGNSRNDMGAYGGPGVCNWADLRAEPVIRINPDNVIAGVGREAQMGVIATGDEPLSYQWSREGTALPAQTNSVLKLPTVQLAQAGSFTVMVSNALGSITQTAQLMVSRLAVTAASLDQSKPMLLIANGTAGLSCTIFATNAFTNGDAYDVTKWPKAATITLGGAETKWTDSLPLAPGENRIYGVVPAE